MAKWNYTNDDPGKVLTLKQQIMPLFIIKAPFRSMCFICILLLSIPCGLKAQEGKDFTADSIKAILTGIQARFAPDSRVEYYNYHLTDSTKNIYIESTSEDAIMAAREALTGAGAKYTIHTQLLPDSDKSNGLVYGITNVSVTANRKEPKNAGEIITQMILGMPMDILKNESTYSLVRTPDGYLSWVSNNVITKITPALYQQWKSARRIIYTDLWGRAYQAPSVKSLPVSDLVQGSILKLINKVKGYYKVEFPDSRIAYIRIKEAKVFDNWRQRTKPEPRQILNAAYNLIGVPYLWGGASVKSLDCSGFTQTCYFINGLIIPRDASQQALTGHGIDIYEGQAISLAKCLANLKPADLLFFGTSEKKITHTAIYMGNGKFIHSSGMVKISSFDPSQPDYDGHMPYLQCARRITDAIDNKQIISVTQSSYY